MMTAHVIIGCDGEVFAVLLSKELRDISGAMTEFGAAITKLMDEKSLSRAAAMATVANNDFSKELDPDAESFVAYLVNEYGMDQVAHDSYHLPN